MKVTLRITISKENIVLEHLYKYHSGAVDKLCGASDQMKNIGNQQTNLFNQMTQQAQQIFGGASQVFGDLMSSFAPIVAAGPNQQGFSPAERANLESQAVTQGGIAARNVMQANKEAIAAQGGGNMALPSGAAIGRNLAVENAAAENTANTLAGIRQADWQTGRENFFKAAQGLAGSTNVFNPAISAGEAATGSGKAAADTASAISQQDQGWQTALMGTLGGLAGTAMQMAPFSSGSSPITNDALMNPGEGSLTAANNAVYGTLSSNPMAGFDSSILG